MSSRSSRVEGAIGERKTESDRGQKSGEGGDAWLATAAFVRAYDRLRNPASAGQLGLAHACPSPGLSKKPSGSAIHGPILADPL